MSSYASPDDFDLAKEIFDKLKDLSSDRRDRVLRWVAEGLGTSWAFAQPPALSSQPHTTPSLVSSNAGVAPAFVDIKSFMASKAPKSDTQFAAAVAYYYRFEAPPAQRRDTIDGQTLQEAARMAGRKRVTNPRFTLNNAKAAGYLDGDSSTGFSINSVGENLVAMTLPGGGDSSSVASRKRTKTKAKSTAKKKG